MSAEELPSMYVELPNDEVNTSKLPIKNDSKHPESVEKVKGTSIPEKPDVDAKKTINISKKLKWSLIFLLSTLIIISVIKYLDIDTNDLTGLGNKNTKSLLSDLKQNFVAVESLGTNSNSSGLIVNDDDNGYVDSATNILDLSGDKVRSNELNITQRYISVDEFNQFQSYIKEQLIQVNELAQNTNENMENIVEIYLEKHIEKFQNGLLDNQINISEDEVIALRNGIIEGRVAKRIAEKALKNIDSLKRSTTQQVKALNKKIDKFSVADNTLNKVVKKQTVTKPIPPFTFLMNEPFSGVMYSTFELSKDNSLLVIGKDEKRLGWRLIKSSINDSGHIAVVEHLATGYRQTFNSGF